MRIPPVPQVCFGLLWAVLILLILITGCSNPSSQNLASLTVTATPSTVSVGGSAVLKAVAHLSDGTTQDVTSGTQWTLSNTALATMTNTAVTAKAPGTVTVQAAYVEATPAGTSPSSASTSPENLSASTQVTITASPSDQHSDHQLECARGDLLWHSIEQHAAERDRQRGRNLHLHAGCRHRAQSRNADTFRSLHADQHKHLFCSDSHGEAHRESSHSGDHLGSARPHRARNSPGLSPAGRHCECARRVCLQSCRRQRACSRHSAADSHVYSDRYHRLRLCHGAQHSRRGFIQQSTNPRVQNKWECLPYSLGCKRGNNTVNPEFLRKWKHGGPRCRQLLNYISTHSALRRVAIWTSACI